MSSEVAAPARPAQDVQWTRCPSCDAFVYHKRLKRNLGVCPECNYHFRLPVKERIATLFDEGSGQWWRRPGKRRPNLDAW